jgi:hypothetical protein
MPFSDALFAGLRSLHIHDATIEYSNKPVPIMATQVCSTVHFSKIRFIVNSSVEKHLYSPGQTEDEHRLFVALGRNSTLYMEDCVLETTFDCPSLCSLVVCTAMEAGQVREMLEPAVRDANRGTVATYLSTVLSAVEFLCHASPLSHQYAWMQLE